MCERLNAASIATPPSRLGLPAFSRSKTGRGAACQAPRVIGIWMRSVGSFMWLAISSLASELR